MVNKERLLRLANLIESLDDQKLNMSKGYAAWDTTTDEEVHPRNLDKPECVGCILGWTIFFGHQIGEITDEDLEKHPINIGNLAMKYLSLSWDEAHNLYYATWHPGYQKDKMWLKAGTKVTPKEAATELRRLANG